MKVGITNFGGIITFIKTPDRDRVFENIVLACNTLAEYEADTHYVGALIGRYCNRIAAGRFELDGGEYILAVNNDPNHLHGGNRGFGKVVWNAEILENGGDSSLHLAYLSEDGEEGYPGALSVKVRYTLTRDNRLVIEYEAGTDRATPVNLSSHGYFNLSGELKRDILGHQLKINADHFIPVDRTSIPTGEIRPVAGTPFDFRTARVIGDDINSQNEQIEFGGGYDHHFLVNADTDGEMVFMARLAEPESGRVMEVHSSEPGLQFYSGNFLDDSRGRYGLCLETQHCPDSPNQTGFPSTILRSGELYRTRTEYSFLVDSTVRN